MGDMKTIYTAFVIFSYSVCSVMHLTFPVAIYFLVGLASHHSPAGKYEYMTTKAPTHIHDHVYSCTTLARNAARKHKWLVFRSIVKGEA